MSTPRDEIQRRIAEQDRRRRQRSPLRDAPGSNANLPDIPSPDDENVNTFQQGTTPRDFLPEEGAGATIGNSLLGLPGVRGLTNSLRANRGLRAGLQAANQAARLEGPSSGTPNALRNTSSGVSAGKVSQVATRRPSAKLPASTQQRSEGDGPLAGRIPIINSATAQNQQASDGRTASPREQIGSEGVARPTPEPGLPVTGASQRTDAPTSASAQTDLNAAEARNAGRSEAVQGLSPGRRALDSAEVRARRAAGENDPVGSAELAAQERAGGLRQSPGGQASFNVPRGAQVLSRSDGAQLTRTEPVTGRTIVRGDDGIERFQSTVLGGSPRQQRGGLRSDNSGLINARLASGTGAAGEPEFTEESIRQGIQDGTIPDPQVEQERIARNRAIDERQRPQTLRNQLNAGMITQDQFDTETEALVRRQEAVASAAGRSGSEGGEGGGDSAFALTSENADSVARQAQSLTGDPEQGGTEVTKAQAELFIGEARRAQEQGTIPSDLTRSDMAQLLSFSRLAPQIGGFETIGPQVPFELAKRAALNPGESKFKIGSRTFDTSDFDADSRVANAFETSAARLRESFKQNAAAELINKGFDPSKLDEDTSQALKSEFGAAKQAQIGDVNAQLEQLGRRDRPGPLAGRGNLVTEDGQTASQLRQRRSALQSELEAGPDDSAVTDFVLQNLTVEQARNLTAEQRQRLGLRQDG